MWDYINLCHWWLIAPTLRILLRGYQVFQRYQWWVFGKEKSIFLYQPLQMISLRCLLQIHSCFLPSFSLKNPQIIWIGVLATDPFKKPLHLFLLPFQAVLVSGFRPMFLKWMKLCPLSNRQKCIYKWVNLFASWVYFQGVSALFPLLDFNMCRPM